MRDRRVAVRHAQRASLDLCMQFREDLNNGVECWSSGYNAQRVAVIDYLLDKSSLVNGIRDGDTSVVVSSVCVHAVIGKRRELRIECTSEGLPTLPQVDACSVVVSKEPERRCLRETCAADVLLHVATPIIADRTVFALGDAFAKLQKGIGTLLQAQRGYTRMRMAIKHCAAWT